MAGVIHTRVGYAGGTKVAPTYHDLGDHTETIQIDYDPNKISYQELLDAFWDGHNASIPPVSQQYKSIIFYQSEAQRELALASREREEAKRGKIYTEVISATAFYLAEPYHQKYYVRQVPALMKEFQAVYPDDKDFVASTAVARVNGYLGGHTTIESLQETLSDLELSPADSERLLDAVRDARK